MGGGRGWRRFGCQLMEEFKDFFVFVGFFLNKGPSRTFSPLDCISASFTGWEPRGGANALRSAKIIIFITIIIVLMPRRFCFASE